MMLVEKIVLVEKLGLHGQEPCDVADSTLGQGEQQMKQLTQPLGKVSSR